MPAYWIAHGKINTPDQYKQICRTGARNPRQAYDGKVLARGGAYKNLEGPD